MQWTRAHGLEWYSCGMQEGVFSTLQWAENIWSVAGMGKLLLKTNLVPVLVVTFRGGTWELELLQLQLPL